LAGEGTEDQREQIDSLFDKFVSFCVVTLGEFTPWLLRALDFFSQVVPNADQSIEWLAWAEAFEERNRALGDDTSEGQ
jgi:hypothetical protein